MSIRRLTRLSLVPLIFSCSCGSGADIESGDGDSPCDAVESGTTETRTRYASASVSYGQSCVSEEQTRTCTDGVFSAWSGTYEYETCEVAQPQACGATPSGETESRTRYASATVPYGEVCQSEAQSRECIDGIWSQWTGTYVEESCDVAARTDFIDVSANAVPLTFDQGVKASYYRRAGMDQIDIEAADASKSILMRVAPSAGVGLYGSGVIEMATALNTSAPAHYTTAVGADGAMTVNVSAFPDGGGQVTGAFTGTLNQEPAEGSDSVVLTAGSFSAAWQPAVVPACTGTADSCYAAADPGACVATDGCTYAPEYCWQSGTCGMVASYTTCTTIGCSWSSAHCAGASYCTGMTQSTCLANPGGCTWVAAACYGIPTCNTLPASDCLGACMLTPWNCSGTSTQCDTYSDAFTCADQPGCTWWY